MDENAKLRALLAEARSHIGALAHEAGKLNMRRRDPTIGRLCKSGFAFNNKTVSPFLEQTLNAMDN